ncbi:hypothetical protein BGZ95_001853, partial [Linnemannia exigua]
MDWSVAKPPGFILTQFLTDVGRTATADDKRNRGFRKSTRIMDTAEMISHLQEIDHPNFDETLYIRHGYVLKGSVKSNGYLIQVSAFKLHELQAVRYRRLSPDRMPNLLTSTLGGTDKYLKETIFVLHTMSSQPLV